MGRGVDLHHTSTCSADYARIRAVNHEQTTCWNEKYGWFECSCGWKSSKQELIEDDQTGIWKVPREWMDHAHIGQPGSTLAEPNS